MNKNDFYRYCRLIHGWLSALGLVALCFLSVTGITLNHPEWFSGARVKVVNQTFELSESEAGQLRSATHRSPLLIGFAAQRATLIGTLDESEAEGDAVGDELFVRLRGIRGTTFLRANLSTRALDVTIEVSSKLSMLNELHRGERAGSTWRVLIDVVAIVFILMSLVGGAIFVSMSGSRIRTAVLLLLGSTAGLWLIFAAAVS